MESAALDTILQAVGEPTGDQLRELRRQQDAEKLNRARLALPLPMTGRRLQRLVKTYRKAGTTPPWEIVS